MISTKEDNRAAVLLVPLLECYECTTRDRIIMQLLLAKNQDNLISLTAILGGLTQAHAIGFNI